MVIVVSRVENADGALRAALSDAELPIEDIEEPGRSFFRIELDGSVVGFGGYEQYGTDALLRSIVVLPHRRGTGAGRSLTEAVLQRAKEAGVTRAFLLTTSAADFFEHLGFDRIDRATAPPAILATRQAASICSSATMLSRAL